MIIDVAAIAEYDRQLVAGIRRRQRQIQQESFATGLVISDLRVYQVLMP
ncbi:MAG: hypothetical protein VX733_14075 [Candidatus Latescibacterota bacterium]|nr:hypothetical protein [Candidatus Latescibacterota bacterium]